MKHYAHAAVAGTFDRFHRGHKRLIGAVFANADRVSIGIASPKLFGKKLFVPQIESYKMRLASVKKYLYAQKFLSRTHLFPLSDIYGIARHDAKLDALFATVDTVVNARRVNILRKKHGLPKLDIITISLEKGTDGKIISSARIRAGQINRAGQAYLDLFPRGTILKLPVALRAKLREPLGTVVGAAEVFASTTKAVIRHVQKLRPPLVIAVGDVIAWNLRQAGRRADIEIVDKKSKRIRTKFSGLIDPRAKKFKNAPGTLSPHPIYHLCTIVQEWLRCGLKYQIGIDGEEDLLALPAILFAPLGSVVLYGHFEQGVILVEVTEAKKEEVKKLVKKFKS